MKAESPEPPMQAVMDDLLMHLEKLFTKACQAIEKCATNATTQINFNGALDAEVVADFRKAAKALNDLCESNNEAKKWVEEIVRYDWAAWFDDPKTAKRRVKTILKETAAAVAYASSARDAKIRWLVSQLQLEAKKIKRTYEVKKAAEKDET